MPSYIPSKLTKIVATLGPAYDSPEQIEKLILAGVDVFRFNFKHGEIEWHKDRIRKVKEAAKKLGVPVGLMMDVQGPSFRIILDELQKQIHIGDTFEFGSPVFTTTHPHIIPALCKGQKLLIDDGTIIFEVIEDPQPNAQTVKIQSQSEALLKTRKSLNTPGADFPVDLLTERDLIGIDMAVEEEMGLFAFSFARTAQDIIDVKKRLKEKGCRAKVCAKLETAQSMDNLDAIVEETDIAMVARGDLGVETPIQEVPIHQKRMIETCLHHGKAVITATQMMASMEKNKYPTRAEVSDVANAVLDHTDAIMTSGETASGMYPLETIAMMTRIAEVTQMKGKPYMRPVMKLHLEDDASRVAHVAHKLYMDFIDSSHDIAAFVVFTQTGRTAELISHFRSGAPIYAFTSDPILMESLCLYYAVTPMLVKSEDSGSVEQDQVESAVHKLKIAGYVKPGQSVIVLHGDQWGATGGTSTVRLVEVTEVK